MNEKLQTISIRSLYPLARAEGEGVGTAYEYFAKRLVLRRWLRPLRRPRRILVGGLPQKYGASLDFLQLAADYGADVTVADERPERLSLLQAALAQLQGEGLLERLQPELVQVATLADLSAVTGRFDLVLSSEVLQRLAPSARRQYVTRLLALAPALALFAPNAANRAHNTHSGLAGISRDEMNRLLGAVPYSLAAPWPRSGYVDMPPFPPGITRDEAQRDQASRGLLEAGAMKGLEGYACLEKWLPLPLRRSQAHIVYGLMITS